eukprot:554015-Rhodomonas_salina.2
MNQFVVCFVPKPVSGSQELSKSSAVEKGPFVSGLSGRVHLSTERACLEQQSSVAMGGRVLQGFEGTLDSFAVAEHSPCGFVAKGYPFLCLGFLAGKFICFIVCQVKCGKELFLSESSVWELPHLMCFLCVCRGRFRQSGGHGSLPLRQIVCKLLDIQPLGRPGAR